MSTTTQPASVGPIITQEVGDRSTKKNFGWRMTTPEFSLTGHVLSSDEMELIELHTVEDMVVDQPMISTAADLTEPPKGRRVVLGAPASGGRLFVAKDNSLLIKLILHENFQFDVPARSDLWLQENRLQENISGGRGMVNQSHNIGFSTSWPLLNINSTGGNLVGFSVFFFLNF